MPLYHQKCQECGTIIRRVCNLADLADKCSCGGTLKRVPKAPTSAIKEVLDNGIMPRSLERYSDAEEVFHNLDNRDKEE